MAQTTVPFGSGLFESSQQSQSSDAKVWNPTSRESSASSYTNAGTHDIQEHSTLDAVYAGGDTASTRVWEWSTDIEDGTYATGASDSDLTMVTSGTGVNATTTHSWNQNEYGEFGTLWTRAETDDTTETAKDGSSRQTNLHGYDTKQTFQYGLHVFSGEDRWTATRFEETRMRLDDGGSRRERTHSDDKFVIETPAPPTVGQNKGDKTKVSDKTKGLNRTLARSG